MHIDISQFFLVFSVFATSCKNPAPNEIAVVRIDANITIPYIPFNCGNWFDTTYDIGISNFLISTSIFIIPMKIDSANMVVNIVTNIDIFPICFSLIIFLILISTGISKILL